MRKIATLITFFTLTASAHALTFHQAKTALRDYVRRDHPSSYSLRCQRNSRKAIGCNVIENSVKSNWTGDGQQLVFRLDYQATVTHVKHGIRITSPEFVPVTIS